MGLTSSLVAGNFTGTIIADCYSGYQRIGLRSDARIVRAACNARHAATEDLRRAGEPPVAGQRASWRCINSCTTSRTHGKSLSYADREALRADEARPAWQRMRDLLDIGSGGAGSGLPNGTNSPRPCATCRIQWDALQVYLGDGRLPIDNNETEQLMKQVAIGRKNWLFVGSVAAGERAADFLSRRRSSAVRNDLDVCGPM